VQLSHTYSMDYKQLWERWVSLTMLSDADRQSLIDHLHEETTASLQGIATLALSEVEHTLTEAAFEDIPKYQESVAPVFVLAALDGYLLSLMEKGINPTTVDLTKKETTKGLGARWAAGHQKDQNRPYIDKIDQIVTLMLERIYSLRVNQALGFYPDIVAVPYKTTEKVHQYIGWTVYQGFVLGIMEQAT
jgi:hypothetical protein